MLSADEVAPERQRPISRAEYDRLVELGVFDEDERLELLYGTLVEMSPQKPPHAFAIRALNELLTDALRGKAYVQVQLPLAASDDSEPEPDLSIVARGDYRRAHPSKASLVIEVADSTLKKDRQVKGRLYAEAGIPEYWLVNLKDQQVEVHRLPKKGRYQKVQALGRDAVLRPSAYPDIAIAVADILP